MELAGKLTFVGGICLLVLAMFLVDVSPGVANALGGFSWFVMLVGVILYAVGRRQARAERIKF